ncbi:MAG TPA: hypothetical protein ENL19_02560 [candidate division WOR-3 bacterium]|uniref:Bacterial Ig-like domain-containing protein n=1 Tax=candidate division WOR-3 bacterium TaxID=2052148 RepID=A0A7C5DB29_UNCW3|nr:hypothetical protein [candidate division WOR-3 bacterium]
MDMQLIKPLLPIIFFSSLFLSLASAQPHPIAGYAYYENGSPAANAIVNVTNLDTGDKITNIIVGQNGYYEFDVGSPGVGWSDGDRINILISGTGEYEGWKGTAVITLNLTAPYQIVPDIYLSYEGVKIRITKPSKGSQISGKTFVIGEVEGEAIIDKVEIKIDEGEWITVQGTKNWSYLLDTKYLDEGNHIIYARAIIKEENTSVVADVTSVQIIVKSTESKDTPSFEAIYLTLILLILTSTKKLRL